MEYGKEVAVSLLKTIPSWSFWLRLDLHYDQRVCCEVY
jgi:hypothetical protein